MALSWELRASPNEGGLHSVAFGDGVFVTADYLSGSSILTSTDGGVTWDVTYDGSALGVDWVYKVCWNGVEFLVATDEGNYVVKSADGLAWTSYATSGDLSRVESIAASPSMYVKVGVFNSSNLYTSPDGVVWSLHAGSAGFPESAQVIWNGTRFVVSGYLNGTTNTNATLITSPDGITWTASSGVFGGLPVLASDGTRVLCVHENGYFTDADVSSDNGSSFTHYDSFALSFGGTAPFSPIAATFGDGQFVMISVYDCTAYSVDGINWVKVPYITPGFLYYWSSVCFGGGRFVAVGRDISGGSGPGLIMTSGAYSPSVPIFWTNLQSTREIL